MIKIGIIGGAGYTAGELIRILLNHPEADLRFVHSSSNAGNLLTDVHEGLIGETDLRFTDQLALHEIDVLFLCSGHGESSKWLSANPLPKSVKVIDLSQDFRDESADFVYGLPELQRERIQTAHKIANPGCFATCIQLGLLPLAAAGLLQADVQVTGITGASGAGVKPGATNHFCWRNNNLSVYKAFSHQHLLEINRNLHKLQADFTHAVQFVPVRGDFARGIFVIIHTPCALEQPEANRLYTEYYQDTAFTFVMDSNPDMKQVINTNKAVIHIEKHGNELLVVSCIDNLLKGASGQAVQNMNLMFGLPETTGLRLKSLAF